MLNVLIASPGDAEPGRDAVERALHAWNDHRSDVERIILRPAGGRLHQYQNPAEATRKPLSIHSSSKKQTL
jgi:hypothetical protein